MEEYKLNTIHNINLNERTIEKLYEVANEYDYLPEDAIELIVEEWAGMKKIERLKSDSESSSLDSLAEKVESVDKLVNDLILKLERANF